MLKKRLLVLAVMLCLLVVVSATRSASASGYCSCAMTCNGEGGSATCEFECSGDSAADIIRAIGRCCSEAQRITPLQCAQ
jgi:hypothetical protein